MGFWEWMGFENPRDSPKTEQPKEGLPQVTDNVRDSGQTFVFGRSNAGEQVDEKAAMQIPTVYACVRLLAESIAALPLHLYRMTDDNGNKEKARDHPLYKILYRQPNPEMTSFVFWETLMTHLLLWGNAYAQIVRDGKNTVLGLYPLLPENVEVDRDESGELYYIYHAYTDEVPGEQNKDIYFRRDEIFHVPGLGFNGLIGFSPIAMMKNSLGTSIAVDKYGSSFFKNGAQPSGVLEHPGVVKDPNRIRDSWEVVRCGLRAAGRSCGHRRHQPHRGAAGLSDRHTLQGFGSAYIIIKRYMIMKKIFPLFAVIIVLVLAVCSFHIIPTGYTGVKTSFGQIQETTIQSGKLNFCIPFVQSIHKVNNKQQDKHIEAQVWGEASDKTPVYAADVIVTYQVLPEKSAWLYANVSDIKNLVGDELVASAIKSAMAELGPNEVTNRTKIEPLAQQKLAESLVQKYGDDVVFVNKVVINDMNFEDAYNEAIQQKSIAQQNADKQKIENEAAIAKAEADKQVAITNAEAEAQKTSIAADAQAEANRKLAESLSDTLIDYQKIQKWDGKLPTVSGGNALVSIDPAE